jgi:hypothetical protein
MSKVKEVVVEIEQLLISGEYPANIAKRTGYSIELILQVEENLYNSGVEYV